MKKIDSFNDSQIKEIREFFPLICDEIPSYNSKELCPKCKKHHTRMPDRETFKLLLNLYDATDQAWSEVFNVDRASVSKLRKKYNIGSYNLKEVWDETRFWDEWDEGIDMKPIDDFFELMLNFPRANEQKLMEIAEINKYYFSRVLRNDIDVKNKYNQIKSQRNFNNEYQFCIKCKVRKKENYFKFISKNKNKKSVICELCNKENTTKCTGCGKIHPKNKLNYSNNGSLLCNNCVN